MQRGPSRHFSEWESEKVGTGEGKFTLTPRQVLVEVYEALDDPDFVNDIDTQMWVVAGLAIAFPLLIEEDRIEARKRFCKVTPLTHIRFDHLIDLAQDREGAAQDPVEKYTDIRSALKATVAVPGPPLPGEEIYPRKGFIGQYLSYAQETEIPLAYHFWLAVALLGAACRRAVYMECSGYRLYCNQFQFFTGSTAIGKSQAFNTATPLVWTANDLYEAQVLDKELYPPGLGPLGKDGAYPNRHITVLPDKPTPQHMVKALLPPGDWSPDGTEALFVGTDSVGWITNDEVSSWLGRRDNIYEGCVPMVTKLYDSSKRWAAGTLARGTEKLRNICLTCLCASNIEWINKSVTPDMFTGGYVRRTLFVNRGTETVRRYDDAPAPPLDPLQAHVMASQMVAWMQARAPVEMVLAPDAKDTYSQFNKKRREDLENPKSPELFTYYLGKYNFVMKLAMVLAVSGITSHSLTFKKIHKEIGSQVMIDKTILELAINLVENEEPFMADCFNRIGEHVYVDQERQITQAVIRYTAEHQEPMRLKGEKGSLMKDKRLLKMGTGNLNKRVNDMRESGALVIKKPLAEQGKGRPPEYVWIEEYLDWDAKKWCLREESDG